MHLLELPDHSEGLRFFGLDAGLSESRTEILQGLARVDCVAVDAVSVGTYTLGTDQGGDARRKMVELVSQSKLGAIQHLIIDHNVDADQHFDATLGMHIQHERMLACVDRLGSSCACVLGHLPAFPVIGLATFLDLIVCPALVGPTRAHVI